MKQAAGRFLAASFIAGWAHATALAFVATTCIALLPAGAHAQPITSDSRIKTFVYNPNEVFSITTHYGYQSNIEFAQKESIETISVGDRVGWQVVPAGRRLFIRAMEENARTNMTVVTNQRAYQFELRSSSASAVIGSEALTYVVRFFYPSEAVTNSNIPPTGMMPPSPSSINAFPPAYTGPTSLNARPEFAPAIQAPAPASASNSANAPYANPAPVVTRDVAPPAPAKAAALAPLPSNATLAASDAPAPLAASLPPTNRPSLSPSLVAGPTALTGAVKAPTSVAPVFLAPSASPVPALSALPAAAPKTGFAQAIAPAPIAPAPLNALNYRYTFSGSNTLAPTKIFDDGKATYFKLPAGSMPQFELVNPTGNAVNLAARRTPEGLVAVDVVAQNFRLKQAGGEVLVYNEASKGVN